MGASSSSIGCGSTGSGSTGSGSTGSGSSKCSGSTRSGSSKGSGSTGSGSEVLSSVSSVSILPKFVELLPNINIEIKDCFFTEVTLVSRPILGSTQKLMMGGSKALDHQELIFSGQIKGGKQDVKLYVSFHGDAGRVDVKLCTDVLYGGFVDKQYLSKFLVSGNEIKKEINKISSRAYDWITNNCQHSVMELLDQLDIK